MTRPHDLMGDLLDDHALMRRYLELHRQCRPFYEDAIPKALGVFMDPEGERGLAARLMYVGLGLGEAGEVMNQIKKVVRDDRGVLIQHRKEKLVKEAVDLFWYMIALCHELGVSLDVLVQNGCDKMQHRIDHDTVKGDGDDR